MNLQVFVSFNYGNTCICICIWTCPHTNVHIYTKKSNTQHTHTHIKPTSRSSKHTLQQTEARLDLTFISDLHSLHTVCNDRGDTNKRGGSERETKIES